MSGQPKVLIYGYGNPGRLDDGLGPALAENVQELASDGISIDSDYQLTVEDADLVAEHDVAIFADADVAGPEPFHFTRIPAAANISFSTHSIRADSLLSLAKQIYSRDVEGYYLGIRGYEFNEFEERLSEQAQENLTAATAFIKELVRNGEFAKAAEQYGAPDHLWSAPETEEPK